jgi:hypothetical protein
MLISGTLAPEQTLRRLSYHPLEAHFPVAMTQNYVELELRSFCILGVASHRCTTRTHHTAYISTPDLSEPP